MDILNKIILLTGLFIITPSLLYISIYYVTDAIVIWTKISNKHSISTNKEEIREVKYNVPKNLLRIQKKLNEYKVFAELGFALGLLFVVIHLLYMCLPFIKDYIL